MLIASCNAQGGASRINEFNNAFRDAITETKDTLCIVGIPESGTNLKESLGLKDLDFKPIHNSKQLLKDKKIILHGGTLELIGTIKFPVLRPRSPFKSPRYKIFRDSWRGKTPNGSEKPQSISVLIKDDLENYHVHSYRIGQRSHRNMVTVVLPSVKVSIVHFSSGKSSYGARDLQMTNAIKFSLGKPIRPWYILGDLNMSDREMMAHSKSDKEIPALKVDTYPTVRTQESGSTLDWGFTTVNRKMKLLYPKQAGSRFGTSDHLPVIYEI